MRHRLKQNGDDTQDAQFFCFLLSMMALYHNIILRLIMMNKNNLNAEMNKQPKFLTRSHSQNDLPFFCCSTPVHHSSEITFSHSKKHHTPKVSVKELMKKSSMQLNKSQSFNQTPFAHSRGNSSQFYQHSRQQSGEDSSQFNSCNSGQKIKFSYAKQKGDHEKIQNYNTTNYIVDKYIVQPHEVNIILSEKEPPFQQPSRDRFFDLSKEFEQDETLKKGQIGSNNCHFSFGRAQKQQFMSKYLGLAVKQVESRRQSRNSKESGFRGSYDEKQEVIGDRQFSYGREFQRTSLLQFVRDDVNAIDSEEYEEDSESNSEVIQDYKSIMGRMKSGQRF